MSIAIKKSSLVFLIILSFIWYSSYVNIYPDKFKEIESNYPIIWKINSSLRDIGAYLTWKATNLSDKSKEIYDKNIDPNITKVEDNIKKSIDTTKEKIDSVRTTLSWAENTVNKAQNVIKKWQETINEVTEVLWDVEKIGNWVMDSVNKDAMQ